MEAVVLCLTNGTDDFTLGMWITIYPIPFEEEQLIITKSKLGKTNGNFWLIPVKMNH